MFFFNEYINVDINLKSSRFLERAGHHSERLLTKSSFVRKPP